MELTVLERLLLLQLLPAKGALTMIRVMHDLRQELGFSEEELRLLQFKQEGDQLRWEDKNAPVKKIRLGPKAREAIEAQLKQLDEAGGVTEAHLSLFDKFPKE